MGVPAGRAVFTLVHPSLGNETQPDPDGGRSSGGSLYFSSGASGLPKSYGQLQADLDALLGREGGGTPGALSLHEGPQRHPNNLLTSPKAGAILRKVERWPFRFRPWSRSGPARPAGSEPARR